MKLSKLFKVASKSNIKPALRNILIKDGYAYATDSYKAVKLNMDAGGAHGLATLSSVKKAEIDDAARKNTCPSIPELFGYTDEYPDIDRAMQVPEGGTYVRMKRQDLIDLLEAMQKDGSRDTVEMIVPEFPASSPVVFTNKNGMGMIMPVIE